MTAHMRNILRTVTAVGASCSVFGLAGCGEDTAEPKGEPPEVAAVSKLPPDARDAAKDAGDMIGGYCADRRLRNPSSSLRAVPRRRLELAVDELISVAERYPDAEFADTTPRTHLHQLGMILAHENCGPELAGRLRRAAERLPAG
jgi:hypothetical protein